jgi:hypothetical protein
MTIANKVTQIAHLDTLTALIPSDDMQSPWRHIQSTCTLKFDKFYMTISEIAHLVAYVSSDGIKTFALEKGIHGFI